MAKRKAYNVYRSYYELAEDMTDEQRGQYYHAILKMQFDQVIDMPTDPLAKMAFKGQMYTLNQQLDGYKHVLKRGATKEDPSPPPTEGSDKGPDLQ